MSKEAYRAAATFFAETVAQIKQSQWDDPGLGVWSVRDLVGHTYNSLVRIPQFATQRADKVDVESAAKHYHISLAPDGADEAIAQGGREAAKMLGEDPIATVSKAVGEALKVLDETPDGTIIKYNNGGIRLEDYLVTRVLELTVHTLDVQSATGIAIPPPDPALRTALHLLADLGADSGHGGELALLATGRGVIPDRFSVLG